MTPPRAMRAPILTIALLTAAMLCPARSGLAQDAPAIPEAAGFVNDHANLLDAPTRAQLEGFLDQVKKKTGAEFAILTVQTTAPLEPVEYKVRVFEQWGLGRAGEDDGLLMLVAMDEREVRFETGYGLEGVLPDGLQSRIFRRVIQPRFREGDFAGGIVEGAKECAARIAAERGVAVEWDGREVRYSGGRGQVPIWVPIVVFLIVAMLLSRMRGGGGPRGGRRYRGGYWGGWGGGFGGGAGRFGGGSRGGSFGGFGGGMSGGGGGGGRW